MGYLKKGIKGVGWMGLLRGSTRGLAFVRTIVLARILSPEQFGLFGIASLVLAFLEVMTETGINAFIVQEKTKIEKYLNTAWGISIIRGLIISVLLLLLSAPISKFFSSPDSLGLLRLISLVPFLRGFINPAIINFQKKLQFNKEFYLRFTIFFVDAAVAISLALVFKNATSLVWGLLAGVVVEVVLTNLFIKPRPKFALDMSQAKKVVNRGKWITATGIFNYLFTQGDDAVVGRLMDTAALGYYQIAYKIGSLPITEFSSTFSAVTFPIYVQIRHDKKRLKKAFLKVCAATFAILIAFLFVMVGFTKPLVQVLLGEKWLLIVPVIKVLAVFGFIRTYTGLINNVLLAVKKQEYRAYVTFAGILTLGAAIVPLVQKFGIKGAAYSALIGSVAEILFALFFLRKVFKK